MNRPSKQFRSRALLCLLLSALATTVLAVDQRSPLRGTWSFSQLVPSTTLLNRLQSDPPLPVVAVGTLVMDANNRFTGHGVFNTPIPGMQAIELDLNGQCTARGAGIGNGLDCTYNFPAFGLVVRRYCVPMASAQGRCFDEFRCVNTEEAGNTVALIEHKRQYLGTCE